VLVKTLFIIAKEVAKEQSVQRIKDVQNQQGKKKNPLN
jgi:hypothetical protein